jgi:hypothetical protein
MLRVWFEFPPIILNVGTSFWLNSPYLCAAADLSAIKAGKDPKPKKTKMGRCLGDTVVIFDRDENSSLNLIGNSKKYSYENTCVIFVV